jgi:hypothetical protein
MKTLKKEILIEIIIMPLVAMFLYASISKYLDFAAFQRAMHNQPFPFWLATFFIWTVPPVEIVTAIGLMAERTRSLALYIFLVVMGLFTLYVTSVVLHIFPETPCPCGKLIKLLGWKQHLLFNVTFLALAIWAIRLRTRRTSTNVLFTKDLKPA